MWPRLNFRPFWGSDPGPDTLCYRSTHQICLSYVLIPYYISYHLLQIELRGVLNNLALRAGNPRLDLKGLKLSPIDIDDGTDDRNPHAAVRLGLNQDIDFADASTLIRPTKMVREPCLLVERLTLLCIIEAGHEFKTAQTVIGSVSKLEDVEKAVHGHTIPVAGLIQMSMLLRVRLIVPPQIPKINADETSLGSSTERDGT